MADKKTELKTVEERVLKTIQSKNLKINSEGFCWRDALLRLPSGYIISDLHENPALFQNIQSSPRTALRQFDHLLIVDFSESTWAEAIVSFASSTKVHLVGLRMISAQKREDDPFEDDTYKVSWAGSGYEVTRKADDAPMGAQTFATEQAAKAVLLSLYPRTRAA
jgi:hypothetical protein